MEFYTCKAYIQFTRFPSLEMLTSFLFFDTTVVWTKRSKFRKSPLVRGSLWAAAEHSGSDVSPAKNFVVWLISYGLNMLPTPKFIVRWQCHKSAACFENVHRASRPCASKTRAFSKTAGNDSEHKRQHLESHQLYNNVSVEMAAAELLRMLQPRIYCGGRLKLVPRSAKWINVLGKYVEK